MENRQEAGVVIEKMISLPKAGPSKTVTLDALSAVFHLPINDAAKEVRWLV